MQLNYKNMKLFKAFPENARVWIYQTDRPLGENDKTFLNSKVIEFVAKWSAHGSKLMADSTFVGDYFLLFVVDEKKAAASGCSIDSSVKFVKELGVEMDINFFNRMKLVVKQDSEVKQIDYSDLKEYANWDLYNPLISTVQELNEKWLIPVTESPFLNH
jgi:hypothetical protein